MGRLSRDKRDIFYRLAKEKGYRARSAFKLLQLDAEFNIFINKTNGQKLRRVVDLCAAPGSWSQVLVDKLYVDESNTSTGSADTTTATSHINDDDETKPSVPTVSSQVPALSSGPRIVAVDLQPMAPIDGVHIIQGDITSIKTAQEIIAAMVSTNGNEERAELVVCDGAPDVTGLHDVDEYLQSQLLLAALLISTHVLCTDGTFIAKIFRGPNISYMYAQLRTLFHRFKGSPYLNLPLDIGGYVNIEDYVARALRANRTNDTATSQDEEQNKKDAEILRATIPFVACGDLSGWSRPDGSTVPFILDADKSYPMTFSEHIAPIAPPIEPPYQSSIAKQKLVNQMKNMKP